MRWLTFFAIVWIVSCSSAPKAPSLYATWYAYGESIGYLNIERMALDLRPDSTYRYYYKLAPRQFQQTGQEVTEGGVFHVQGDSLVFNVRERNEEKVDFLYARQFRMLPDTSEWPLRVHFQRRGVDFEVYFQEQK